MMKNRKAAPPETLNQTEKTDNVGEDNQGAPAPRPLRTTGPADSAGQAAVPEQVGGDTKPPSVAPEFEFDEELRALLPPPSRQERVLLQENLLRSRHVDDLAVWYDPDRKCYVLVDGYNRHAICAEHNIPFGTWVLDLPDREAVKKWIIEHHRGRRNLRPNAISYHRGRLYLGLKQQGKRTDRTSGQRAQKSTTAKALAALYGVDERTIRRDAQFTGWVDAVARNLGEEAKEQILSGEADLARKDLERIATLGAELQREALGEAIAGGGARPTRRKSARPKCSASPAGGPGAAGTAGLPAGHAEQEGADEQRDQSKQDKQVFRKSVARLQLPLAWLLRDGEKHSISDLVRAVAGRVPPAELAAAARLWERRRPRQAANVTDPAEKTRYGIKELVQAVFRLPDARYATTGGGWETSYWPTYVCRSDPEWHARVEAINVAAAEAERVGREQLRGGGGQAPADLEARVTAALPAGWDELLRGVVADAVVASVQSEDRRETAWGGERPEGVGDQPGTSDFENGPSPTSSTWTEGPEPAVSAGLPAEHAEQEGTGEPTLNDRPEGPPPASEGASGGEADYLFDQDFPDLDDEGCPWFPPWEITFVGMQWVMEDLERVIFDPDKQDRTQAVELVEDLIYLSQQLREELDTRATTPAPSARCPGES
jgi:hypothetical protein